MIWRGREQERGEAHGIGGGGSYACVGLGVGWEPAHGIVQAFPKKKERKGQKEIQSR